MSGLTRRAVLKGAGALACPHVARAATPRLAAIDWALLETALSLDAGVVAGSELMNYRRFVVEPAPPPGVADLGLRGNLNYEALIAARPDLILSAPWYARMEGSLARIAPVLTLRIDQRGRPPYAAALDAARAIAARTGGAAAADALHARVEAALDEAARRVRARRGERFFLVSVGDPRHFRAFGADSVPGEVLARLGLANAWTGNTRYSAQAPIDILALAADPEAGILMLGPLPPDALRTLPHSALWNALPAVAAARVHVLPPANPFGGLPTAGRLARLVADALA